MVTPTAALVREWSDSATSFADLGYPEDSPDRLDNVVLRAVAYVQAVTGRVLDSSLTDPVLVPLAQQAVQMRTEQLVHHENPENVETAGDEQVVSFSAGPYSESRVDPARRGEIQRRLNGWPALADVLWLLMTPERWDYWMAFMSGVMAPAEAITEVDWGGYFGPYEAVPGAWGWQGWP